MASLTPLRIGHRDLSLKEEKDSDELVEKQSLLIDGLDYEAFKNISASYLKVEG